MNIKFLLPLLLLFLSSNIEAENLRDLYNKLASKIGNRSHKYSTSSESERSQSFGNKENKENGEESGGRVSITPKLVTLATALQDYNVAHFTINRTVNLSNQNLDDIQDLDKLNINGVSIKALKDMSLDLSHNNISLIPDSIGTLTNMVSLNLSNNQLGTLPSEIGKLTKLKNLNLANNNLRDFPSSIIQELHNLQNLNLTGNQLTPMAQKELRQYYRSMRIVPK